MMIDYKDFPLQEAVAQADAKVAEGDGMVTTYQKWTCLSCGSRQTMETPNKFYRAGVCEECKHTSIITRCNYLTHIKLVRDQ